ncbi:MAG: hypothetical protein CM15mP102_06640 [Flavobacteriales bacterium]|nr:MAG: hypothetical protein CM15mP102_06640 [Flavobacteriales bacterium]
MPLISLANPLNCLGCTVKKIILLFNTAFRLSLIKYIFYLQVFLKFFQYLLVTYSFFKLSNDFKPFAILLPRFPYPKIDIFIFLLIQSNIIQK